MATRFDIITMIIYLLVITLIGFVTIRKVKNNKDFLVAGSRLGYGLYVPAMAAVVLGGASTLGGSGLGYKYGISGMWLVVMIGLGIVGMGLLFSKKLAKTNVLSVSELLGNRFGSASRTISAVVMAVYDLMVAVTGMIAMGIVLSTLFGWSPIVSIVVGGVFVLLYTILGGMWAITLTDVIQFWIMTAGLILVLLPMGIWKVGGIGALAAKVDPAFLDITNIGGAKIFSYFLLYFFGMMIGQDIWQRAFTAKNATVLRKGIIYAGIYCIIYAISGAVIGMTASILLPNLAEPQQAIPQLAMLILPMGLFGLVLAAVASAVMSTASGTIMASATILVNDMILPHSKKAYSEKQQLTLTRVVLIILGAVAIIISAWMKNIVVALDVAYALLSGSIFLPVIAAFFWKKVTAKVTLLSMLISAIVVIIDLIAEGLSSLNAIMFGIAASGITMAIGTLMFTSKTVNEESPLQG